MNNYEIAAANARRRFLTYDCGEILRRTGVQSDEQYLYPVMLGVKYRLCRSTGGLQRYQDGWQDANTFAETMTLLDWLCDSKPGRYLTGRLQSMHTFGLQFHQNVLEKEDPLARLFQEAPERMGKLCEALGGTPVEGGDISYGIELYDGLCIVLRFWQGDEEFSPRVRYYWDENALQYLRYETMFYAIGLLESLLFSGGVIQ